MNKKIKQVIAAALALVMCAGALMCDPHPVMANDEVYGFWGCDEEASYSFHAYGITDCRSSSLKYLNVDCTIDICPSSVGVTVIPYIYKGNTTGASSFHSGSHSIFYVHVLLVSESSFSGSVAFHNTFTGFVESDSTITSGFTSVYSSGHGGYIYDIQVNNSFCDVDDLFDYSFPSSYIFSDSEEFDVRPYSKAVLGVGSLSSSEFELIRNDATLAYEDAVDELGYLQNVAFKSVRVASTTEPPIIYLPIDRFTFSNTTTKDVLLNDADYDIEYFIIHRSYASKSDYDKKNVYKKSWSDLYYLSKQEHVFNDSTVNSIDNGVLWYYFDSDSSSWVSEISEGLNRTYAVYSSIVYMRPVKRDGNTLKCGGWTKIDFDLNNSPHVTDGHNPFDDDNPQGMPDDDGNFGDIDSEKDIDYDIGYGDNVDDAANDNSNIDDIIDFVNDFDLSSLSDILVQLGEAARSFANLLGVVFGWMPSWVRASLIAAVSIWIFMLIKRAIF